MKQRPSHGVSTPPPNSARASRASQRPAAPAPRRRRRWLLVPVLLALLAAGAVAAWGARALLTVRPGVEGPVVVEPGSSTPAILAELEGRGVIADAATAAVFLRLARAGTTLKAGEYAFREPHTSLEAIEKVLAGRVERRLVTVREGLTMEEIFPLFVASGIGTLEEFRAAAAKPAAIADLDPAAADLEGYLFPETYSVVRGMTAETVVAQMVGNFKNAWASAAAAAAARGASTRELVTLASIVESEARRPEERALVASVYANRLRLGMPLQADPTVVYALKRRGAWTGNIRRVDLEAADPYNTYRNRGLPPGPICNPGAASLAAAAAPADAPYLYFVARNDGSHVFSKTLAEHNRWVNEYQRRRRRSAG